jgi:hypothetical protein
MSRPICQKSQKTEQVLKVLADLKIYFGFVKVFTRAYYQLRKSQSQLIMSFCHELQAYLKNNKKLSNLELI